MHYFRCFISRESISQCSVLPKAPGLRRTHRISALQRICCKCAPASRQRWAIPQTLADQTEGKSYWQCLEKETKHCELCHCPALAKPYWTQLSRSRGKTQYTDRKINNLELTTTKWLQVIPFYHPRAPRVLQGGSGMRKVTVKMSITNRFNSVCNKELPFVTYTLHWQLKCNKYLSKMSWRYFTRGICFLELFKSSALFPCLKAPVLEDRKSVV